MFLLYCIGCTNSYKVNYSQDSLYFEVNNKNLATYKNTKKYTVQETYWLLRCDVNEPTSINLK